VQNRDFESNVLKTTLKPNVYVCHVKDNKQYIFVKEEKM